MSTVGLTRVEDRSKLVQAAGSQPSPSKTVVVHFGNRAELQDAADNGHAVIVKYSKSEFGKYRDALWKPEHGPYDEPAALKVTHAQGGSRSTCVHMAYYEDSTDGSVIAVPMHHSGPVTVSPTPTGGFGFKPLFAAPPLCIRDAGSGLCADNGCSAIGKRCQESMNCPCSK